MSFPINVNIPNGPNNPSDDQPEMKTNFGNISGFLSVDHVSPGATFNGIHKQVHLINQAAPGLIGAGGVQYANIATGQSWPFWQNALGSFQMITPISGSNANGSITIPGGLIVKFGFVNSTTNGMVIFNTAFPTACLQVFTNPYYVGVFDPNGAAGVAIKNTPADLTTTSFKWVFNSNSGAYSGFFWLAIGV